MQFGSYAVFNKIKKTNIFRKHAKFFTKRMKVQWDKGGNSLLLGDGTGGSWSHCI
jgi:hypothetical protein